MQVELRQYMLPDGRKRQVFCDVPDNLKETYEQMRKDGRRLACEVLSTGHVSITIEDDRQDYEIEVCDNGPGALEPPQAVAKVLERYAKAEGRQ